mgnify:FL=1
MFRLIFPNRYLVWTIALIFIMALLLLGTIERFKIDEEISMQEIVASSTISHNSTAGWKTYRNEKYGFEVKYPPDWNPKVFFENTKDEFILFERPTKDNTALFGPEDFILDKTAIRIQEYKKDPSISLLNFSSGFVSNLPDVKRNLSTFLSFSAVYIPIDNHGDYNFSKVLVEYNPLRVIEIMSWSGPESRHIVDAVFKIFLSTFRFIR